MALSEAPAQLVQLDQTDPVVPQDQQDHPDPQDPLLLQSHLHHQFVFTVATRSAQPLPQLVPHPPHHPPPPPPPPHHPQCAHAPHHHAHAVKRFGNATSWHVG